MRKAAGPSAPALVATAVLLFSLFAFAVPVLADHESGHESYVILESTEGDIIPGTTEIGLQGHDDSVVTIALPFDVIFYETTYSAGDPLIVSSNGNIQFEPEPILGGSVDYPDDDDCLPTEANLPTEPQFNAAVFGLFADFRDRDDDGGVFTAVYGEAPNRYLVIEWRTEWYSSQEDVNFEIILYENSSMVTAIYGDIGEPRLSGGDVYLMGVQEDETAAWKEYACFVDYDAANLEWTLASGTVHDYVLGIVEFSSATYTVDEDAGTATITVLRSGTTRGEMTVGYTTAAGTATAGADYTESSGTLTFADGQETATFAVPIVDDEADEADETVLLALDAPGHGAVLGNQSDARLTIVDDDAEAATTAPTSPAAAITATATATATATPTARTIPNTSSGDLAGALPALLAGSVLVGSIVALGVISAARRRASR